MISTTRPLSLTLRELPSFSTSPQLFYSRRMDAVAGRDAKTRTSKARAEQRTGITTVGEQEQQPNVTSEWLDAQDQISEMENLFDETTGKLSSRKPTHNARQVRLDYATVTFRLRCAMSWSRISRRSRRLSFLSVLFPKFSGHCKRALTFSRWGKRRYQWRAVMSCGELLALFSAADTTGSWRTTSSPGACTV